MTLLTPNFADQHKTNGAAGPVHVVAPHEPTREGEKPPLQTLATFHEPIAPAAQQQPLKIAIVGTAPSSRMLAPYNDPSWQIWGCSPGNMNQLPRFDVWFEIHSNLHWPEHESYGRPYLEWLKNGTFPVYMQDNSFVPRATAYPILEMCEMFGDDFFSSSFAYMMALGISMGASELALYGVDMASRDEYILQRPGGRYFINEAKKRNIKVTIPYESDLGLPSPLYGYIDSTQSGRKLAARDQEVGGRIGAMENEIGKLQNSVTYLKGAREDIDYVRSIQLGAENERIILRAKVARLEAQLAQMQKENEQLKSAPVFVPQISFPNISATLPPVALQQASEPTAVQTFLQAVEEVSPKPEPKRRKKA